MIRRSSPPNKAGRVLLVALVALLSGQPASAGAGQADRRHLFLDDRDVARIENLRRTMHPPAKKGAVIRPELAWEEVLQTRSAPAWDKKAKRFQLWLITSTPFPGVAGMTYVESKDGLRWTKPILRQYKVNGSLENNFVTVDPKRDWPANAIENVVYDPDDADPARRYKGLGACDGREPMVSADGIRWKLLGVPKLPSQDESNLSYDRETRTFLATLKQSGPNGRAVTLSASKDFENWSKPKLVFHADAEDQKHAAEVIKARLADRALQQPTYHGPRRVRRRCLQHVDLPLRGDLRGPAGHLLPRGQGPR